MARLGLARKEAAWGYLFISPWLVGFLFLMGGPIIISLVLSLFNWDLLSPARFVGLGNLRTLLRDRLFWQSLKVTGIFTALSVPLSLVLGVSIAVLMNQKIPGVSLLRTLYYLPSVVSGVAVSLLWAWVLHPDFGLLNLFLKVFGIHGPAWLQSPVWALPSLVVMSLWQVGGTMIIYLAGLQGIPTQLYEAAWIDGANRVQTFLRITIPMITPVLLYNVIVGVINALQVFTQPYIMTSGGPNNATLVYVMYLYQNGFQWFKMGYASALAWILFLILLVCTVLLLRSATTWVYYEGGTESLQRSKNGARKQW
jgi:multiple sugar transport system permease protein